MLEDSGLETASLLEDTGPEPVSLLEATLLEDSTADDPVAAGIGLFTASSPHAVKDKTEIDASIASTEA